MTYDNVRPVSRAELARHGLYISNDGMPVLRIVQPEADSDTWPYDAPETVEPERRLTLMERFWLWLWRRMGL